MIDANLFGVLHALLGDDEDARQAGWSVTLREDRADHRLGIPLGRIADADHIAGVVAALCRADFAHVSMQEIYVDGGATLHA
ncbi:SDR family oxidoreductase [Gephyromycinifex aptenodytis]|uniref:SDR family oxidoreductase n=1 Tax=Gephyromycinifex aptenodytis TaxID=2716227 RepID=UPI001446887D|nr:SDR family oxidoreductase [Gephyromycinifex aptenodytis]